MNKQELERYRSQGASALVDAYERVQHHNESLTAAAETLLALLKLGDDPAAAMYQLEEVLSDAP